MKKEKVGKKLQLNKTTIVSLDAFQTNAVRGGAAPKAETEIWGFCASYHPLCYTKPQGLCTENYCSYPMTNIIDCTMPTAPQACCTNDFYPGSCIGI